MSCIVRCDCVCVYSPRASCVDVAHCGFSSPCKSDRIPPRNRWIPDPNSGKPTEFRRERGGITDRREPEKRSRFRPIPARLGGMLTRQLAIRRIPNSAVGQPVDFVPSAKFPHCPVYEGSAIPPTWQRRGKWKTDSSN